MTSKNLKVEGNVVSVDYLNYNFLIGLGAILPPQGDGLKILGGVLIVSII
jgi:hypothetical protein